MSFSFWESLTIVLIIVIGGLGNIIGIVVGAAVLIVVPELLGNIPTTACCSTAARWC